MRERALLSPLSGQGTGFLLSTSTASAPPSILALPPSVLARPPVARQAPPSPSALYPQSHCQAYRATWPCPSPKALDQPRGPQGTYVCSYSLFTITNDCFLSFSLLFGRFHCLLSPLLACRPRSTTSHFVIALGLSKYVTASPASTSIARYVIPFVLVSFFFRDVLLLTFYSDSSITISLFAPATLDSIALPSRFAQSRHTPRYTG